MDEKEWMEYAFESQYQFFETLGSRYYDEIEKTNLFLLKKKVGFATCGKPSEMPSKINYNTGYTKEELVYIKSICEKIVEKSDYDPIRFSCTILILFHKGTACETPVFRIVTNAGNIFIDACARVYQSWDLFMTKNKLPDCKYCYPLNGEYDANKERLVGFAYSPASSFFSKATDCLDVAGSVTSVAAAGVVAAASFVTVTPVLVSAAGIGFVCTGVYSITRSVGSLYDRNKHEQSIGLGDQEARSAWMSIGSSAVGFASLAAVRGAQKIVEGGKTLGKLGVFGLHALTASSLVFSGFGFVESLIVCTDKYKKGKLTKKDVFDLSCELLFLFNAIASARATAQLVNNMSAAVSEAPSTQKKLTKTQKRNLRKRAAKKRAQSTFKPTECITEESSRFSGTGVSATLQMLLFEAVKAYSPRLEEILFKCHSIGHDIMCWKAGEMSDFVLLNNLGQNLVRLYNEYKDEIADAIRKVVKFFTSLSLDDVLQYIYKLFETATEEVKSVFCTKIIDVQDQMEVLINEAETDLSDLQDSLNIENCEWISDSSDECESFDDGDLNPEAQNLLKSCRDVINVSKWSCNDLEDFGEILDGVKYVIVSEFNAKVDNYKKSLKAAKSASEERFNLKIFHEELGIRGDVSQHLFNETLKGLTDGNVVYKIKTKLSDIRKERNATTTPVWEALTDGMFHYHGRHGAGDLSNSELISVVNNVIKSIATIEENISLTDKNCKLLEARDVVMISLNEQPDLQIVVYCGITKENTATGIIMIVK